MKIVYFIVLFLEMSCFLMKQFFYYIFQLLSCIGEKLNYYRRVVYCKRHKLLKQKKERQNKKNKDGKVILQHITMQINTGSIVGKTRTEFLKESDLPGFNKPEIIHSIPLEKEITAGHEEDEDIDPDDVEATLDNNEALRVMLEEENDDPGLYDEEPPADDLSMAMGVSLDELSDTFNVLKKNDCTQQEEKEAKLILEKIEGTAFLLFYLMQNESMERAKLFMQDIESENQTDNGIQAQFDISKYI
jgi:hypothetical protein